MMMMKLTSTDVAFGAPGSVSPTCVDFSPAGLLTCLLPAENGLRQVHKVTVDESGCQVSELVSVNAKGELTLEEQLRLERMRKFSQGVSTYSWTRRKMDQLDMIIIPINGQLLVSCPGISSHYVYDGHLGVPIDAKWSPDGQQVAFVVNRDIYVIDLPENMKDDVIDMPIPTRLTFGGQLEGVSCGLADFLAQEEMDRYEGFWWSPDSSQIVYAVLDETAVPVFHIMHPGSDNPHDFESHKYPFTGGVNPIVNLSVVSVRPLCPALLSATDTSCCGDNSGVNRVALYQQLPPLLHLPHIDNSNTTSFPTNPSVFPVQEMLQRHSQREDNYIGRVGWWPDGTMMVQITNRTQTCLQLLKVQSVAPFASQVMLTETRSSGAWINLHDMLHCMSAAWRPPCEDYIGNEGDFYFIWASEDSGFMRLNLYKYDVTSRQATVVCDSIGDDGAESGWVVDSIAAVDESKNLVYFHCNRGSSIQKHLYVASLVPGIHHTSTRLTDEPGWHDVTVDVAGGRFVDVWSSVTSPVRMCVQALPLAPLQTHPDTTPTDMEKQSRQEAVVVVSNDPTVQSCPVFLATPRVVSLLPRLTVPNFFIIDAPGVVGGLCCCVYRPNVALFGEGPYPCVVSCYGGPHVQRVTNSWATTADMRVQRLVESGVLVLKIDNRGSSRRGLEFESAIQGNMGDVEVLDQQAVVRHFSSRGLVDPHRVGIFGWSYGGYMTLMALCRAGETFCCGVSGAPVTSWDGYDSHYTERYMGLPTENPSGYQSSSVMSHVSQLESGRLLLVHGLIDENVHFRHTARLLKAITAARKRYDVVLFPDQRHGPRSLDGLIYLEDRVFDFFMEHLTPVALSAPLMIDPSLPHTTHIGSDSDSV